MMDLQKHSPSAKMLKLCEELRKVEEEREMGSIGCTIDALEEYLNSLLNEI